MKKRIILFLTFLLTTMFLTGCTVSTSYERIKEINKVANEVAQNGAGYKLPEGYSISYPDTKDTGIIQITGTKKGEEIIRAKYEIANGAAEVIEISMDDGADWGYFIMVLILMILSGVIGGISVKYSETK